MRKKYPHYQAGGPLTVQQRALKKVERDVRRGDPVTFEEGVKSLAPEMLSRDDLKSRLKQLMEEKAKRLRAEDQIKLSGEQQRSGPPMMSQAPMPRASGGILSFQTGGAPPDTRRSRGYRPRALPQGYGGMSGYAGYGMPGEMTQQRSYVAPELASQWADITGGIMQAGTRKYDDVRYKGPRLAGFTPQEAAYKAAVTSIGTGQGPQATRQAEQTLGDAATGIGGVATAAGSPSLLKDADLSKYESQYTQGVIDPQIRAIREAAKQRASELGSSAAQAGAFGGYRHGLQEQAIGQQEVEQIGDVTAKGYEQAFRSAQEAQQKDAQAEAAARAQQLGAYGQLTGVAGQEASLGGQQQRDQMTRLQAMRDAGTDTREMQQAAYDIQRAEHQQEMAYPEKQLSWMSSMLNQTPYQNIQSTGVYTPQASPLSTMIGAGVGGAGAAAAWGGNQPNQPPAPPSGATNPDGTPIMDPTIGMNMPDLSTQTTPPYMAPPPTPTVPTPPPPPMYGGGILGLYGGGMMPRYGRP
jgi:hypothetical protein